MHSSHTGPEYDKRGDLVEGGRIVQKNALNLKREAARPKAISPSTQVK